MVDCFLMDHLHITSEHMGRSSLNRQLLCQLYKNQHWNKSSFTGSSGKSCCSGTQQIHKETNETKQKWIWMERHRVWFS